MADAGKFALSTYSGNGSQTLFSIGFPILDSGHLEVKIGAAVQTQPDDYSVNVAATHITFVVAPVSGSNNITVTRVTPHAPITTFANAAGVTATNLNNALVQGQYRTEEVEDKT